MVRRFNRYLKLQAQTRRDDGAGGFVRVWEARGGLWAEVRMRSGDLRHTEFGRTPRLLLRITTPELAEAHPMRPLPGDRLLDGRRVFEVEAVHEGDRRVLVILAAELPGEEGAR